MPCIISYLKHVVFSSMFQSPVLSVCLAEPIALNDGMVAPPIGGRDIQRERRDVGDTERDCTKNPPVSALDRALLTDTPRPPVPNSPIIPPHPGLCISLCLQH